VYLKEKRQGIILSLAAIGLFVVLTTSIVLFTVIKIIGAGYLINLGMRMLMQKSFWIKGNFVLKSKDPLTDAVRAYYP
jgi:threonine/homoserine/homoserine lactone efflux protein